jgi:hypothetical protein
LGVGGRQGKARLTGQPLNRLMKAKPFSFLKKTDQIAMLAARKTVVKALIVIDEKRRCPLLGKRRQARILTPLPPQLHRFADNIGQAKAGLYLIKETIIKTHAAP